MNEPIICFGQQPNGIFPKRYLYAKIESAKKLQKEIGGRIIFFYHDSDADYRETITLMHDLKTGEDVRLNFTQENKIQKKYSPFYKKIIPKGWKEDMINKLPRVANKSLIEIFKSVEAENASDFCLEMYKKIGLLDGIEIVRSGDKEFRMQAEELDDYYADIEYEGEIVRAKKEGDHFTLHEGGGSYIKIPTPEKIEKWQKNPARDHRFKWMQSVIHATHYVSGKGEGAYLKKDEFPDVIFVTRDMIEEDGYAYLPEL
jgi:hypothetical protein